MTITGTDLSLLKDNTYRGETLCGNFSYGMEAVIKDNKLISLVVTKNRSTSYAKFAEGVVPKILKKQSADVDAITGATTTSKCLMKAVEQTLKPESGI